MATENLETVSSGIETATALRQWADNTLFEFQHSVSDRCDQQLSELGMPFMSKRTFIHPQAEC
jgi:hypothetical protein